MPGDHDAAGSTTANTKPGGGHNAHSQASTAAHDASAYAPPSSGHGDPASVAHAVATPPGQFGGMPRPHGQPAASHDAPGTAATASSNGEKPSTGDWLGGLAAAVLAPEGQPQSGLQTPGAMPGGAAGPAGGHGAPGFDGEGYPPGFTPPGALPQGSVEGVGATPSQPQEFEAGTAENAVQQFVLKIKAGETEGLDKLISEKTNDKILAPLRDGTADPEVLAKGKTLAVGATLLGMRESGNSKVFTVRNAAGQTLTITARREESGDYKVASLRIEDPRGRRR